MPRRFLVIAAVITLSAFVLAACGDDDDDDNETTSTPGAAATTAATGGSIPATTITAKDFAFEAPASLTGGLNRLVLKNTGKETHHAQLVRLNDGVSLDQFQQALQQGPEKIFPLIAFAGGPSNTRPGVESEAVVDLKPGQYMMLCFFDSDDGVPHLAKGMVKPFEVKAATAAQAAKPEAKGKFVLKDFAFEKPATIAAGKATYEVVNNGPQPHEMGLLRLKEGGTLEQVKQLFSAPPGAAPAGPPPVEEAGGFQAIAPGGTGWATLDLKPGNYVLVCFIPDPASGRPHLALGMIDGFSVK